MILVKLKAIITCTATRHMNSLENPEGYEPVSVKYDKENHRHVVKTRSMGKMYYSFDGSWY